VISLKEKGFEDGRWLELANDHVLYWASVLAVWNFMVVVKSYRL